MGEPPRLELRIAGEGDFEAIHRLNYRTFVEEIPQHSPNPERRLVDRFHSENTYVVCYAAGQLVGMVAGRTRRPFSLDEKLPDLDRYLPPDRRVVEVRLLAVAPGFRRGRVFARLVGTLARHFRAQGCDLAVVSGTLRQRKLYQHLGFTPFGPEVGGAAARYQPMYLTLERFLEVERALAPAPPAAEPSPTNFLPGPVALRPAVHEAFARPAISHRSPAFAADLRSTRRLLCELTGAGQVELLLGSGTLANEAIGGQLSLLGAPGLVLANGEFGERLIDHARRWRLDHEVVVAPWGEPFDWSAVRRRLAARPVGWLWAAHCETSTGVLNDLDTLRELAAEHGVRLCLDSISSLGAVTLDLRGVFLASGVSGKALAALPGLALLFHHHPIAPAPGALPRYLDLGLYSGRDGVPFTFSSNLLQALQAALAGVDWPARLQRLAAVAAGLRSALRCAGFQVVAPEPHAAPAVVTVALPPAVRSPQVGRALAERGVLIAHESDYLVRRNWIQVCLMGEWREDAVAELPAQLAAHCPVPQRVAG